jgi:hypothetical protein
VTKEEVLAALAKLSLDERRKVAVEAACQAAIKARNEGHEVLIDFDDEVYRR